MTRFQTPIALAITLAGGIYATPALAVNGLPGNAAADKIEVADPYADNQDDSPWNRMMQPVNTMAGISLNGRASGFGLDGGLSNDLFTPFRNNQSNMVSGYGSTEVGFGCDGLNLGGVMNGQLRQYGTMVEELIQQAPAMAIMFLAYSQPTVKAVIDELNGVSMFGIDMSNATCSGVRQMANMSLAEKRQSMAEAQCTAEAGFKDPKCMTGEGITGNLTRIMQDTKTTVNDRAGALMGSANNTTGGLIRFRGGIDGSVDTSQGGSGGSGSGSGSGGSAGSGGGSAIQFRDQDCEDVNQTGMLGLILGSSEINCSDMKNYAELLPNYESDGEVQGVIPRQMTLLDVSKRLTEQYYTWIGEIVSAPYASFNETEGFKALVNRTGIVITDNQHRALVTSSKETPNVFVAQQRQLASAAALKDLAGIVGRLDLAVMTGLQNQESSELISPRIANNYLLAVDTLESELNTIQKQMEIDGIFKRSFER
ncbi:hypothetical protein QAO71_17245 (plasmid) [Halopseudomonas sp. SMJS2]|uniref:hypothetical protein n=1 Tax=Halopseudomonas sp. SMJS2 TaxID=3041098 RepID=UPI00245289A5|nr:hypothetical protein [Halopseudomonas sp. SMJS2]WGK63514.1 hypothetical protein QAO71_17245 [Halopseudomonas sp. SMJS2]